MSAQFGASRLTLTEAIILANINSLKNQNLFKQHFTKKAMSKIMNVVFGIILAFILFLVIILGVKAFYPAPDYEEYQNEFKCNELRPYVTTPCTAEMSGTECTLYQELESKKYQESIDKMNECNKAFSERSKNYDGNIFFIYNILGIILFVISFLTLSLIHVSAGTALAGLALNIGGFSIGWDAANDMIKFLFGLIILGIVIWLIYAINKKYQKDSE